MAKALDLPASRLKQGSGTGLTLVIGSDWPSGTTYPSGTTSPTTADTRAAVSHAHARTADQSKSCARVSPYKTVTLNGVNMTPAQAYASAGSKPDSDS
ncbi:hypothetical protein [Streptomyces sp. NPDC048411]|uniref:hypothetical protein n=1 Tax=Streptomyces sp. NPDC048411 TaxID=3157206 RepID=UPI003454E704